MQKINKPIFIFGVGRSGTSLLQSMLNAHPDIAFLPETHFFRKYIIKQAFNGLTREEILSLLREDDDFKRAKISEVQISDNLPDDELESEMSWFNALAKAYLDEKQKHHLGDKDPRNMDFVSELKHFFPDARVIHLMRDPRDVVLSRTKADWSKSWPFFLHAYIYRAQMPRGRRLGKKYFGEAYLELNYETLIGNAEETLKQICVHVGVDYDPAMLAFSESAKELVSAHEVSWKKETFGPLLTSNTRKWEKEFSDYQIAMIQKVNGFIFKNGYERHPVKLPFYKHLALTMHQMLSWAFMLVYPWRLKLKK
ncbi:MAG: hypothetical protein GC180_09275 [Bacteroidetes bacterium]|nr:hypothetical protein [Bacteroidota bacterium]